MRARVGERPEVGRMPLRLLRLSPLFATFIAATFIAARKSPRLSARPLLFQRLRACSGSALHAEETWKGDACLGLVLQANAFFRSGRDPIICVNLSEVLCRFPSPFSGAGPGPRSNLCSDLGELLGGCMEAASLLSPSASSTSSSVASLVSSHLSSSSSSSSLHRRHRCPC